MKEITRLPNGRIRVRTINTSPSRTDGQWKDDCDTNTIIKRFKQTGQITHLSQRQGSFADVSEIKDLLPSLEKVQEAKDMFYTLPSNLRTKFGNSITNLIEFLQNPENQEEAIKLGLFADPSSGLPPKAAAANEGGSTAPAPAPAIKEEATPPPK